MKRDIFKDEQYFLNYLKEQDKQSIRYAELIKKVLLERGESDKGVRNGHLIQYGLAFSKLRLMYSGGVALEEITRFYSDIVYIMKKVWTCDSGYVEMVWMLAIGNMLPVAEGDFNSLVQLVENEKVEDYLINYMIQAKLNKNRWKETDKFKFEEPYNKLKEVIENKKEAEKNLLNYLNKYWYKGHSDMGWYETHKKNRNVYSGYWSFESGAIAKIMGLNDSLFKESPYYPYDMVHYSK